MAHHNLKGMRKPKLLRSKPKNRKDGKTKKDKAKALEAKGEARGEKVLPGKRVGPAEVSSKTGKTGMNKKEARALANLEKAHRDLYAKDERILLVGEGNFSFARSLCKHLGSASGVYATSFDTAAQLSGKYDDAAEHRKEIEETFGGTCLTGVDCTRIHKIKEFKGAFRKIVFNFPHMGSGEKDVEKSVAQHRQLLAAFFASAVKCLDLNLDCSIHVSLKSGEPYRSWKLVQTARAVCPELDLLTATPFMIDAFEGYEHRRTAGFNERHSAKDSEELEKGAKVYVFRHKRKQEDEVNEESVRKRAKVA